MTVEEAIAGLKLIDKYFQHIEAEYKRKLEEIHAKAKEKVESFVEAYKDPDEFCCLFVVDKEFTRFVFIPYPED